MKVKYIANDGTEFDSENECKEYESRDIKFELAYDCAKEQLQKFTTTNKSAYYFALVNDKLYTGYDGKHFWYNKPAIIKSLYASIGRLIGDTYDYELQNKIFDKLIKDGVIKINYVDVVSNTCWPACY